VGSCSRQRAGQKQHSLGNRVSGYSDHPGSSGYLRPWSLGHGKRPARSRTLSATEFAGILSRLACPPCREILVQGRRSARSRTHSAAPGVLRLIGPAPGPSSESSSRAEGWPDAILCGHARTPGVPSGLNVLTTASAGETCDISPRLGSRAWGDRILRKLESASFQGLAGLR
jgi:hypothetical protein